MYEIQGKVALVTGGASGIGFAVSKQLLINGAKGVNIADINVEMGKAAANELKKEFGEEKVNFIPTNVAEKKSFEDAFENTLKHFKSIDILVNNAGIFDDVNYERMIDVNLKGTTHGIVLALKKYMANQMVENEKVIINTSSTAGCRDPSCLPIYAATKSGINTLTRTFGGKLHYDKTKIKIVSIAPGYTDTKIFNSLDKGSFDEHCRSIVVNYTATASSQTPEFLAKNMIKIIKEKPSGTIWICENNQEPFEYIHAE